MYSFHSFSPASLQGVGVWETVQYSNRTDKSDFQNSWNLVFNQEKKATDFLDVAVIYLVG